jgi:hypothetical protein
VDEDSSSWVDGGEYEYDTAKQSNATTMAIVKRGNIDVTQDVDLTRSGFGIAQDRGLDDGPPGSFT